MDIFNDCYEIIYNKYNIKVRHDEKNLFNNISNIELKGKIFLKELVEKVFKPERLFNISNKFNIDFIDLIDIYS